MYTVGLRRDFIAQHFLIGGDWGAENFKHSHHYVIEIQIEGDWLDSHGYLVDIVDIEKHLTDIVLYYQDQTLNDLPQFAGLNPSLEHFSRLLCQTFASRIKVESDDHPLKSIIIKLWENEVAWAMYRMTLDKPH